MRHVSRYALGAILCAAAAVPAFAVAPADTRAPAEAQAFVVAQATLDEMREERRRLQGGVQGGAELGRQRELRRRQAEARERQRRTRQEEIRRERPPARERQRAARQEEIRQQRAAERERQRAARQEEIRRQRAAERERQRAARQEEIRRQRADEARRERQALTPQERRARRVETRREERQALTPEERRALRQERLEERRARRVETRREERQGLTPEERRALRQERLEERRARQAETRREERQGLTPEERRALRRERLEERRAPQAERQPDVRQRRAERRQEMRQRQAERRQEVRQRQAERRMAVRQRRAERRAELRRRRAEIRRELRQEERLSDQRAQLRAERRARQEAWERRERRRLRQERRRLRDLEYFGRADVVTRGPEHLVLGLGGGLFVVNEGLERLRYGADRVEVVDLGDGWTKRIVYRRGGVQVVTIRDGNGIPVQRYRVLRNGEVTTLFNNLPPWWGGDSDLVVEVAPPRVPEYRRVIEPSRASAVEVYDALTAEPFAETDRTYTLNQVLFNADLRAYMPRVDVDTINFAFGSAEVPLEELDALEEIGVAIEEAIEEDPGEVFLVEGHTDAVGSELVNLQLSDERAEAVAALLTEFFDIPPENLVTQGFGEEFLKVPTEGRSAANRRVAIRRITPLLATSPEVAGLPEADAAFAR